MNESLPEVGENFLEHLRIEKEYSPATLTAYERDLHLFANEQPDLLSASSNDIKRFIARLNHDGLAASSISRVLSCLRSFFKYALREGLCTSNPATVVRNPKGKSRLPKTMDVDQMNYLLDVSAETPIEKRDLAMFELLYSAGIRLAELVGIDINDVDLRNRQVFVTGKGNKTRYAPIGKDAAHAIRDWLSCRETFEPSDPLFTSKRGTRLTPRSVQLRLKNPCHQTLGFKWFTPAYVAPQFRDACIGEQW